MAWDDVLYYLTLTLNIFSFILDIGTAVIAAYLKGYVGLGLAIIFFGQLCQLPNLYLYLRHLYANEDGVYKGYLPEQSDGGFKEPSQQSSFFSRGLRGWDKIKYWIFVLCVTYSNISRLLVSNLPNLLLLVAAGYSYQFAFLGSVVILSLKQLSILLNSIETSENWIKEKRFGYCFDENLESEVINNAHPFTSLSLSFQRFFGLEDGTAKKKLATFDKEIRQKDASTPFGEHQFLKTPYLIDLDQFGADFKSFSLSFQRFFGLDNKEWASTRFVRQVIGMVPAVFEGYLTYITCQLGHLYLLSLMPFWLVLMVVSCRVLSDLIKVFQFNRSRAYDQQAHLLNEFAEEKRTKGNHILFGLSSKRHVGLFLLFSLMESGSFLAKNIATAGAIYLLFNKFSLFAAFCIQPIYVTIFVVLATGLSTLTNSYQRCAMVWSAFMYQELNENPNGMKDRLFVDTVLCKVKAENLMGTKIEVGQTNGSDSDKANPNSPNVTQDYSDSALESFSIKQVGKEKAEFQLIHRVPTNASGSDKLIIKRNNDDLIYDRIKSRFSGEDESLQNIDLLLCPLLSR